MATSMIIWATYLCVFDDSLVTDFFLKEVRALFSAVEEGRVREIAAEDLDFFFSDWLTRTEAVRLTWTLSVLVGGEGCCLEGLTDEDEEEVTEVTEEDVKECNFGLEKGGGGGVGGEVFKDWDCRKVWDLEEVVQSAVQPSEGLWRLKD